jgi:hypothetical protein
MAQGTCTIEDCDRPLYVKGMCRHHYRRANRYGDPLHVRPVKRCAVEGCVKPYLAGGYCEMHYARLRTTGSAGPVERVRAAQREQCSVRSCAETSSAKGLCPKHYQRFVRFGDPLHVPTGAHPDGPIRNCKWCGKEFDRRIGGRLLCCSERCRRIVERLVNSIGRYSLTIDRYREMWVAQNGVCKLCRGEPSGRAIVLAIDHDHTCCPGQSSCGECVRGLLCDRCNNGLGCFGDDPELLRTAAAYIEASTRKDHP